MENTSFEITQEGIIRFKKPDTSNPVKMDPNSPDAKLRMIFEVSTYVNTTFGSFLARKNAIKFARKFFKEPQIHVDNILATNYPGILKRAKLGKLAKYVLMGLVVSMLLLFLFLPPFYILINDIEHIGLFEAFYCYFFYDFFYHLWHGLIGVLLNVSCIVLIISYFVLKRKIKKIDPITG